MKILSVAILLSASAHLALSQARAQGTVYFSNLSQQPSPSIAVGSDAWVGQGFLTGAESSGAYLLHSVELGMNPPYGNPGGFRVSLHRPSSEAFYLPGGKIADLTGLQPTHQGVFAYTGDVTLLPNTVYFLVLTSLTPVANGSFSASNANASTNWVSVAGWKPVYQPGSEDGSTWTRETHQPIQFAVHATWIPEPSSLALWVVGGGLLWAARRRRLLCAVEADGKHETID